jgi:hypothetical protein
METARVIPINSRAQRVRVARAVEARRFLHPHPRPVAGRAWINGREVGAVGRRYAHLTTNHD